MPTQTQLIQRFVEAHTLPPSYAAAAERWLHPLMDKVSAAINARASNNSTRSFVLGISGCQGSGKSTAAALISAACDALGLGVATLSLDDFYYGRAQREKLGETVHPLLKTRGVPGTHDTDLALQTFENLLSPSNKRVSLPRFDKASDEPLPPSQWPQVVARDIDIIVFEGWCLGATPQEPSALLRPLNALESGEDPDARWRNYVNEALAGSYQTLFAQVNSLVLLQAPSFECVPQWRLQQERALRRSRAGVGDALLPDSAIERFVAHFERLTRHCLRTLPSQADTVIELDTSQRLVGYHTRPTN